MFVSKSLPEYRLQMADIVFGGIFFVWWINKMSLKRERERKREIVPSQNKLSAQTRAKLIDTRVPMKALR